MKINIINIAAFLLISLVSCISHTIFSIPPTIIFLIFSIIIILFNLLYNYKISSINKLSLPTIYFIIYIFFSQLILGSNFKDIFGPLLGPLYFPITLYLLLIIDRKKINFIVNSLINFSIIIFLFECIWRLLHPIFKTSYINNGFFYMFKNGGLMYKETNALAIHIIVVTFFLFWWGIVSNKKFLFKKLLIILFLLLTFSRAGYFAFIFGILYYIIITSKIGLRKYLLSFLIFIAPFIFYFTYVSFFKNDLSLNSKFYIFNSFFKYLNKINFSNFLFGVGNYNSIKYLGIYAHNIYLVYFIETGFLGLLLFLYQLITFIIKSNFTNLLVVIPFLIVTMASFTIFIPYFYVIMAIIIFYSNYFLEYE